MTQSIEIPVRDWLPDRPSYQNPGCEVADNVIPTPGGFGPFAGLEQQGGTISAAVRGAEQFFTDDGASLICGGTDGALFVRREDSVTETAGYSALATEEKWDFCRFNSFVIATSVNNAPQYLNDLNVASGWQDLPGSPPSARRCDRVLDFVMMGDIDGARNRIQWSSFNNPTGAWASDRLTQANFADLDPDGGPVQKIVGGRYATVFQRRAIQRLNYVGPPVVWQADVISVDRGTIAPFSVVDVGYFTFFLAQDGFYVTNGSSVDPIGTQRVNSWFFDAADASRLDRVQGVADWDNRCIVWTFNENSQTDYDRCIIYSWEENRWSTATLSVQSFVAAPLDGVTLEGLDADNPSIDAMSLSLDDSSFVARSRVLGVFSETAGANTYSTATGTPLAATWRTGDFQPAPHKRVFVSEATPVIDATDWDCTIDLRLKDNRNGLSTTGPKTTGWSGFAPVRGEGRLASLEIVKPAGTWQDMSAVQVKFRQAGER